MPRFCVKSDTHRGFVILKLPAKNGLNRPENSQVGFAAKSQAKYPLSPRTAYISPTYRLHDLAIWPILILTAPYIEQIKSGPGSARNTAGAESG